MKSALDAVANSATIAKEAAAINFASVVVEKRGHINDAEFKAMTNAGYSSREVAEIVAHVALNVLTNYFNNVAAPRLIFQKVTFT